MTGDRRERELGERWEALHPDLPAKGSALRQQIYRVRERVRGGASGRVNRGSGSEKKNLIRRQWRAGDRVTRAV